LANQVATDDLTDYKRDEDEDFREGGLLEEEVEEHKHRLRKKKNL
jgi:hypothetical protein